MKKRLSYKSISAGVVLLLGFLVWVSPAHAATFTWNQMSWAGAASSTLYATHPTNETGWTSYSSADSTTIISGTSITATSTTGSATQTTASDFSSGTFASTTQTGSGGTGIVSLAASTSISVGSWYNLASVATGAGAALEADTVNGLIYVMVGNGSTAFYSYSTTTNTLTSLAAMPEAENDGGSLVYPGSGNYLYAFSGTGGSFYQYSISGNSWTGLAGTATLPSTGAALTSDDNGYIYALTGSAGGTQSAFFKYSISAGSWGSMAGIPNGVGYYGGSAMAYGGGNYVYAIIGDKTQLFYEYSISGNSWTQLASIPAVVEGGGSLVYDQGYLYAFSGNTSGAYMRYSIAGNSWTTLTSYPYSVTGDGNTLAYGNGPFVYALAGGHLEEYAAQTVYDKTGTFTSSAMNLGQLSTPTTLNWTFSTTTPTVQFQLRSSPTLGGLSSATWYGPTGTSSYYTTSGTTINTVHNGSQYYQYQATLSTADLSQAGALTNVTINDQYYPATTTLISTAYNSSSAANIVAKIQWLASTTASTSLEFQFRSAPDNGSGAPGIWSSFVGPDGTSNTYFASSTGGDVFPADLATSSQWFEYKAYLLQSDGTIQPANTPAKVNSVSVQYVVNAPPQFSTGSTTATQTASGTVAISYAVLDPDTNSGTRTPGYITPSFEYSLNGGSTWTLISTSSLSSSDYVNKAVNQSTYTTYTATWNAPAQIPNQYSTTTLIQVIANDNEAANNIALSTTTAFTLDTTPPALPSVPVLVDESATPANIYLSATDNSAMYMKVGKKPDLSDAAWVPFASSTTLTLGPGDIVYAEFEDAYSNTTAIQTVVPPETPSNVFYQDTSDPVTEEWRIFFAWGVIDDPAAGFQEYNIYRSVNGGAYSLLTTVTNRNLNYIVDNGLVTTSNYSYKLTAEDSNGDISGYSSSISHMPDGSGGTDLSIPVLSTITTNNITSTGATITWTTNKYSDSEVFYLATSTYPGSSSGVYSNSTGVPSVVESHSVTLSNLTPGTQYYFLTQSIDPDNNVGTSADSSYTFTTTAGPVISNTSASTIFDTSATITWNTDSPANSTVYYSTSPTMSSPSSVTSGTLTTNHSLTITGLVHGMKYYYYVTSADSDGNTAIDNNVVNGAVQYYSFTTTYDTSAPVISGVSAANVGVTGATIAWTTDKSATSRVTFATSSSLVNASTTTETTTYSTGHAVILSDLLPGTTYYYTVFSTDVDGNATSSPNDGTTYSFTTVTAGSFLTFPQLTAVAVSSTTSTGATISWTSDINSDSSVYYTASTTYPGPDRGAYQNSVGIPSLVQSHNVILTGLNPSTQYFFFVQSTDSSNDVGTSSDSSYTFTTTAGPVISSTTVSAIQDTSANVTWTTSVAADSVLYYSTSPSFASSSAITGSKTLTTAHVISLTGLTQGTTYYYYVTSTDGSGNTAIDNNVQGGVAQYYNFSTVSDNSAPAISDVSAALVGTQGATITWTTDKNATSRVTYDTDPLFGTATTTVETTVYTTAHAVVLSGLQASTTYYYSVYSADQNGNNTSSPTGSSTPYTFDTEAVGTTTVQDVYQGGGGGGGGASAEDTTPPTINNIQVTQTGQDSVTITYTTSKISNGVVSYGLDTSYGNQEGDPTIYQLNHSDDLTGLIPMTTYHFSITSADVFNNTTASADATFTLADFASPNVNTNLYSAPNASPATAASSSDVVGDVLTATQKAILDAESVLETLPADQFTAAILNITSKIISPPVISGTDITVVPGAHSAEISWTTDKPANSLVAYADEASYDPTAKDPYMTTSGNPDDSLTTHTITLPNLEPDTTYHFQVSSQGVIGSTTFSSDHTFKTGSALPQVFNTTFTDIGENSATINWNTDVPTKAKITLKNTQNGEITNDTEASYDTDHTYSFNNLDFSTPYTITIVASNASSTASDPMVIPFSTVLSTAAPVISNVRVTTSLIPGNVEVAQTIVSWTTDKPSTSRIFFGQGSDGDLTQSTPLDNSLTTDHVVITTLLTPGTVYKIKAESGDSSGNVTDSAPYTLLTPAPAGSIVDLIISNLQSTFGVFTK